MKGMHRRDVMRTMTAALLPAAVLQAGPKIPNDVFGSGQANLKREPFGDLRIYFDGTTDQLQVMTAGSLVLKPGMTPHAPHQHPEEEFLLVTEGTGEISLEGKVTPVGPGSMMYSAAGKMHGITNTGKTPLTFYFYKWRK